MPRRRDRPKPRLPPVNATRANVGPRGPRGASTCRIAAKPATSPTPGRQRPNTASVREPGTSERGVTGPVPAGLPPRGYGPALNEPCNARDVLNMDATKAVPRKPDVFVQFGQVREHEKFGSNQKSGARHRRANRLPEATSATMAAPAGSRRGYAPCPRRDAVAVTRLPPVNATRANGGTRGRDGGTCRIAAKRLGRPRRDAGATGHNARERDTGERRDAGRQRLPDRGQRLRQRHYAATDPNLRPRPWGRRSFGDRGTSSLET